MSIDDVADFHTDKLYNLMKKGQKYKHKYQRLYNLFPSLRGYVSSPDYDYLMEYKINFCYNKTIETLEGKNGG